MTTSTFNSLSWTQTYGSEDHPQNIPAHRKPGTRAATSSLKGSHKASGSPPSDPAPRSPPPFCPSFQARRLKASQLPWKLRSPASSQWTSRNGAGGSPTRRVPWDGHVRRLGPEASPPARAAHSGCQSSRLHTAPAPGPRCQAGALGLRLTPGRGPARPDPPAEARYLGRGWGRDGGQGSGTRAQRRQGQLQQGKIPTTTRRFGRRRENAAGGQGGGERSRAPARGEDKARELSRDTRTLAKWRLGHVTPGVL
ncbi:uncharacterized protein LOC102905636 [Peromyscus maniculatus bairdii]|uniref:uncharacterized protein LOC102905636 n=1 Tax=Peromyscus maniculatus bairdii TaxID=230844 RepID=UPI003FCFC920